MKFQQAFLGLCLSFLFLCCAHDKNKKYDVNDDPAKTVIPSNSDATNPSLADTAYVNKDTVKKYDSSKKITI